MTFRAEEVAVDGIARWRGLYRHEMGCQIIHHSLHSRGWAKEFVLSVDSTPVGYGSVAVGGPWKENPAMFEFFVLPSSRNHAFDLFIEFMAAARAKRIDCQSNDPMLTVMLHTFGREITSESILFEDRIPTEFAPTGASFRIATVQDGLDVDEEQLPVHGVVELDGQRAGSGGILFHYNRPYGDIYMEIEEGFRRRGLGAFLVQELKRLCYHVGSVPAARCNVGNIASRKTLQKAGFVPCGNLVSGALRDI